MLGGGADGGVDLRLRKDGLLTLVQCKQRRKGKVGLPVIRELLGAMTAESANKGMLVTTSAFTSEAITFAQNQGIQLINGTELSQEIGQINQASDSSNSSSQATSPITPSNNRGKKNC